MGINAMMIGLFYAFVVYLVLGAFQITVITDYPFKLRSHLWSLKQLDAVSLVPFVITLSMYCAGLAFWPHTVCKHRI